MNWQTSYLICYTLIDFEYKNLVGDHVSMSMVEDAY